MEKKEDKLNDYEGFVEKFKRKKTTDDCFTPQHVYEVIVDWLSKKCSFNRMHIIRPFYPDKDYKETDYYSGSVVIDNPPFSILAEILRFYNEHNIYFFLFCPHLTSFQNADKGTVIVADITIEYENGAKICTDFITNFPEFTKYVAITSPELRLAIEDIQKKESKVCRKERYIYPKNVVMSTTLGRCIRRGVEIKIPREESCIISCLDSQKQMKKSIFGQGLLVSNRLAQEIQKKEFEGEIQTAKKKAKEKEKEFNTARVWPLSDKELQLIKGLDVN